jgi:hypothetical protein
LSGTVADPREFTGRFAAPEEYVGYEVFDTRYRRIGRVAELLVNAGEKLEYVRVRVGWLGLRSVLIPVHAVWVSRRRRILMLHRESTHDRRMAEPRTE